MSCFHCALIWLLTCRRPCSRGLCLSASLSVWLSLSVSVSVSLCLSVSLSLCLSVSLSLCLCLCLCLARSLSLSLSRPPPPPPTLCLSLSLCPRLFLVSTWSLSLSRSLLLAGNCGDPRLLSTSSNPHSSKNGCLCVCVCVCVQCVVHSSTSHTVDRYFKGQTDCRANRSVCPRIYLLSLSLSLSLSLWKCARIGRAPQQVSTLSIP